MRILVGVRFLFIKSLICKVFSILFNDIRLRGVPETVAAEPFAFSPITLFNERSRGVHFEPRGVHLLIIPRQRKKPEQLRSDLGFRAVLENKCDLSILVNDGFFNHHRPDGVVPVMHHFRLFLEAADIKCHFLVLLASGGA